MKYSFYERNLLNTWLIEQLALHLRFGNSALADHPLLELPILDILIYSQRLQKIPRVLNQLITIHRLVGSLLKRADNSQKKGNTLGLIRKTELKAADILTLLQEQEDELEFEGGDLRAVVAQFCQYYTLLKDVQMKGSLEMEFVISHSKSH